MLNKEKLIEWCWLNLQFYNAPETWEETYITDILDGCNGICHTNTGNSIKYWQIRSMFTEYEEEEENVK